jgi:hypothetical protein
MPEYPDASDRHALHARSPCRFHFGQQVWSNGRQATFIYQVSDQAAAIRYQNERDARIVPLTKLAATPPGRSH